MFESLVLTVIADDRPGIVKQLSHLIEEHGGNWTDSSMLSLAGKFAGILLLQGARENSETLLQSLRQLENSGLQVAAHRSPGAADSSEWRHMSLELLGQDRPGIVHDITAILGRHGVNVRKLVTGCESASMSAELLFRARAELMVPAAVARAELRSELEALANELMVDREIED